MDTANPEQNNGYAYARNSPIDLSDPSGFTPRDLCAIPGNECGKYAPSGGGKNAQKAPPAAGQSSFKTLIYNQSEKWGGWAKHPNLFGVVALYAEGVNVGADGNLRSRAHPGQGALGYGSGDDKLFSLVTDPVPESFPFSYKGVKYVIWAWKAYYSYWGDGTEVGAYAKTNPFLDAIEGYNSMSSSDPNLPKMSVNFSVGGSKLGSFAPPKPQDWVGFWDPSVTDRNPDDMHSTVTVTFRNAGMYSAFMHSNFVENSTVPLVGDPKTHSATFNF